MQDTYSMTFPWPTNDVNSSLLNSMESQCRAAAKASGHKTIGKAKFVGINRVEGQVFPFEYEFVVKIQVEEVVQVENGVE